MHASKCKPMILKSEPSKIDKRFEIFKIKSKTRCPLGFKLLWRLLWRMRFCYAVFIFLFFSFQSAFVDFSTDEQCIRALFINPQILLFSNFFIKNGFYSTIHIFKNYFTTVFSISAKISSI